MELDGFTTLATGLDHPEGAAWGPDGRIYAGGEAGQIYAIGLDGSVEQVGDTGGFLFGVTVDGDGAVYGCDMGRGEIVRVAGGVGDHLLERHARASVARAELRGVRRGGRAVRDRLGRVGRGRRAAVPRLARRRDDRVDRRGPGVPERLLPERRGRRAAGGGVGGPPRGAGPHRGERRGGPGHRGGRPHRVTARRHRARRRRHDVRRLLPPRPHLPRSRPAAPPRSGPRTPTA